MCDSDSQCCITRVVDGDDHDLQLAQLQAVMQRIQTALRDVPGAERTYIGNALLNLAVNRILREQGSQHTASMLMRLSDAMHAHAHSSQTAHITDQTTLHG